MYPHRNNARLTQYDRDYHWQHDYKPWYFDVPITELDLTVRSFNGLRESNIKTLNDIRGWRREDIARIRNIGERSAKEIIDEIQNVGGLFLDEHEDPEYVRARVQKGHDYWIGQKNAILKHNLKPQQPLLLMKRGDIVSGFCNNTESLLTQTDDTSVIHAVPDNIVDLTTELKEILENRGYGVQVQLVITKPENNL